MTKRQEYMAALFQKRKLDPDWRARRDQWQIDFHAARPLYGMVKRAKRRARELGIPFDLDDQFIYKPTHCPILGLELDYSAKGCVASNSPSLDQIIPRGGYVMTNVRVISHRANTLKSDATPDEVRLIYEDLLSITKM